MAAIEKHPADYKLQVENRAEMNCGAMDAMDTADSGNALYGERGPGTSVRRILSGRREARGYKTLAGVGGMPACFIEGNSSGRRENTPS